MSEKGRRWQQKGGGRAAHTQTLRQKAAAKRQIVVPRVTLAKENRPERSLALMQRLSLTLTNVIIVLLTTHVRGFFGWLSVALITI